MTTRSWITAAAFAAALGCFTAACGPATDEEALAGGRTSWTTASARPAHSQGGQAAFIVLQKAEQRWAAVSPVLAGLAVEPASGYGAQPSGGTWQSYYAAIRSPMFMFSGAGTDGLVSESWVRRAYTALDDSTEAYFWAAYGARHVPPPNALTNQVAIPWFRWKLLGDADACRAFQALATQSPWVQRAAQNAEPCL